MKIVEKMLEDDKINALVKEAKTIPFMPWWKILTESKIKNCRLQEFREMSIDFCFWTSDTRLRVVKTYFIPERLEHFKNQTAFKGTSACGQFDHL